MKIWNAPGRKNSRRKVALKGLKVVQVETKKAIDILLSDPDVEPGSLVEEFKGDLKRMGKEISILEERVVSDEVARSIKRKKNRRAGIM